MNPSRRRWLLPALLMPACAVAVAGTVAVRVRTRLVAPPSSAASFAAPQPPAAPQLAAGASANAARPHYQLALNVNYNLLTFTNAARITVPASAGDPLRDVVFFLNANAEGVGGAARDHNNIEVDGVTFGGAKVPFTLDGAVLRVTLPAPQKAPFTLKFQTHGVVPRAPQSAGALAEMMGGSGLEGLLGGATQPQSKNTDFGLYTFGSGVLSLGSFWYPALAVRQNGKWVDDAPEGLGDVGYSEMSDFDVVVVTANGVEVAATGSIGALDYRTLAGQEPHAFQARNVRDFAVLMSRDWTVQQKSFDVGGKPVRVASYTLKKDAAQGDKALDVAGHALQIYAKRFGPYLYDEFKVVEGPIRGGAGGMEFSGMTSVANGLYGDLQKELGGLAGSLGAGGDMDALKKALQGDVGTGDDGAVQPNAEGQPNAEAGNPAQGMLNGLLGSQKALLDSMLEATVAHETGHQWWAMGVGSDSQRAPWLDEALTNYSATLYFEDRYGAAKAAQIRDLHLKQTYSMARMMGAPDAPANLKTAAYTNMLQYGAVIYGKAALFYDALRHEIGDAAFFGALRDYYGDEKGKLASAPDLLAHLERRAPAKKARIEALYREWILESHGDQDVAGGKVAGLEDLLGGMLGGTGGVGE